MYNNNYILNLLNIKDKNIFINTNTIEERIIKGKNYKIIEGFLTYNPEFCPICGVINESRNDIIKWGYRKNCKIKIPKVSNCLSMIILHKQRFYCKHCHNTFIAETNLIDRNKNISNNTELQINLELMKKQSEKDIAERLDISVSKIDRKLNDISSHTVLRHESLQKEIVQYLINTDKTLEATYECYQAILNSIKDKDFNKFKSIVFHRNKNISPKMIQALKLFKDNIKYIENSFKYDINNGIIEGTNNLIKCLKRIAFGYKRFDHFISRIFLIKGIIKE